MSVDIRDRNVLHAVSPAALSAYARTAGWRRVERYGDHSDVYAAENWPEVILPRTDRLGDYPSVVSQLVGIFAKAAGWDEPSLYRVLVTADRDVIRVRVTESDDGSLTVNDGIDLIGGARDMLLSVACSMNEPKSLYRLGANKEASNLLNQVRLGQTDQGSFVVTLLTPVVPPPMPALLPDPEDRDAPVERKMTKRLSEALTAAREATEKTTAGDGDAFADAVASGVSANLCEALVRLIGPFPTLDIGISWARTRPVASVGTVVRFARADSPILREAARLFRDRVPRPDARLYGFVRLLAHPETDDDGTIRLVTSIDGQRQSVTAVLEQSDYEKAVHAHGIKALVTLKGDLERTGQRWRLLNPRVTDIIDAPELD